MTWKNKLKGDW